MKKIDTRFAKKIGIEYELFPLACPHYHEFERKVAEIAGQYNSETPIILEIGCGTGLTTKELHKAKPNGQIIAIDAEEIMVQQAKSFLKGTGVKIVCADALEYLTKLKDDSIDIVASAFCLHNTPSEYRKKVFQEVGRVLKSDGLCVIGDKIAQDDIEKHW